jgi:hypothetical protein
MGRPDQADTLKTRAEERTLALDKEYQGNRMLSQPAGPKPVFRPHHYQAFEALSGSLRTREARVALTVVISTVRARGKEGSIVSRVRSRSQAYYEDFLNGSCIMIMEYLT